MAKPKPCSEQGCTYPKATNLSNRYCGWHWALRQNIEVQIDAADHRLRIHQASGAPDRTRVPASEWPAGERWCAGCQSFIPTFYATGSRCKACASRAAHAQHIQRTYGLDEDEYRAMLKWQGGRCWICRRLPQKGRRLAVDHDHATGAVRGLICAHQEWGCNRAVLGNIPTLEMARRVVMYYEKTPIERWRAGEPWS